jgi:hypothetical protein
MTRDVSRRIFDAGTRIATNLSLRERATDGGCFAAGDTEQLGAAKDAERFLGFVLGHESSPLPL